MCVCVCLSGVGLIGASIDRHRSNRRTFCDKKVIGFLAKQKEKALIKQKEHQESLIGSIFPPAIAKDLIAKQANEEDQIGFVGDGPGERSYSRRAWEFERTLARMHPQVSWKRAT